MWKRLHVKCSLFLSDFNKTCTFRRDFLKSLKYQIAPISVQWELLSWSVLSYTCSGNVCVPTLCFHALAGSETEEPGSFRCLVGPPWAEPIFLQTKRLPDLQPRNYTERSQLSLHLTAMSVGLLTWYMVIRKQGRFARPGSAKLHSHPSWADFSLHRSFPPPR